MEKNLRKRKTKKSPAGQAEAQVTATVVKHEQTKKQVEELTHVESEENWGILGRFLSWINVLIGLAVMVLLAYKYCVLCDTLHDNQLWFSNIKEVEREISFRTESGLYYSYYKQLVNAPSISKGLYDLTHDNVTEHLRTINILERFNIFQEVFLAIVYKSVSYARTLVPIYFYIHSIYALQGLLLSSLYLLSWTLSGSWIAGALTAAFYVLNKNDTTRVAYTAPLRESFALPFLWGQILCISLYIKSTARFKGLLVFGAFLNSFLFAMTWQFAQFVFLLQAAALYAIWVLDLVPKHKVLVIYLCKIVAMLGLYLLQYGNKMLLGALVVSLIPAVCTTMLIKRSSSNGSGFMGLFKTIFYTILVAGLTLGINKLIKIVINLEADEHIFKFIMAKFGFGNPRDFDSLLYMCNDAFKFLNSDPEVFHRMTRYLVFPLYTLTHVSLLILLFLAVVQNWWSVYIHVNLSQDDDKDETLGDHYEKAMKIPEIQPSLPQRVFKKRPELAYHTVQMVLFGGMALAVLRMKYLWTPYMCVMAAFLVSDSDLWSWICKNIIRIENRITVNLVRHVFTIAAFGLLLYMAVPELNSELENLREFYDPDTVQLMEWIKESTPVGAAFTGSMQLLAGVKLCTGRPLTNHPHYEDKTLRERTVELMQIYGKRTPDDIYEIMKKYDVSYMILEDSICLSPQKGCRLADILDLDHGVLPTDAEPQEGLTPTTIPSFCDKIRKAEPEFTKYFRLVFQNKTFRIYEIL